MSNRHPQWQLRLEACLAERWARAFAWGDQDCALFAASCVEAVTGTDPAIEYRGRYSTETAAYRVISRFGGMDAMAAHFLGEEIAPALAQVGDIGLGDAAGRPMFVVCGGGHWLAAGEHGVVTVAAPARAWRAC